MTRGRLTPKNIQLDKGGTPPSYTPTVDSFHMIKCNMWTNLTLPSIYPRSVSLANWQINSTKNCKTPFIALTPTFYSEVRVSNMRMFSSHNFRIKNCLCHWRWRQKGWQRLEMEKKNLQIPIVLSTRCKWIITNMSTASALILKQMIVFKYNISHMQADNGFPFLYFWKILWTTQYKAQCI